MYVSIYIHTNKICITYCFGSSAAVPTFLSRAGRQSNAGLAAEISDAAFEESGAKARHPECIRVARARVKTPCTCMLTGDRLSRPILRGYGRLGIGAVRGY